MSVTVRSVLLVLMVLIIPIMTGPARAVQPDEVLQDAALETRARSLSSGLRCLVCQNQSIDDSDAPLARDLRLLVRERLVAGDSDSEVIDFVVGLYGEFVLLKPRVSAHTYVLWFLPFVLLLLGGLFLWSRARRMSEPVAPTARLSREEDDRLAELLGDTDGPRAQE